MFNNSAPTEAQVPTSAKIVFESWRDGNGEIYIMNADGSKQENLTRHGARDGAPVWSPTGKHIAFHSDRDGTRDIYIMNPDGRNVRKVLGIHLMNRDGNGVKKIIEGARPAWSPQGDQLLYDADQHIFRLDMNSGNKTLLSRDGFGADWFDPATLPVQPSAELLTTTWGKLKQK